MSEHVNQWYEYLRTQYYKYYLHLRHQGFDVNEASTLSEFYRDNLIGSR